MPETVFADLNGICRVAYSPVGETQHHSPYEFCFQIEQNAVVLLYRVIAHNRENEGLVLGDARHMESQKCRNFLSLYFTLQLMIRV